MTSTSRTGPTKQEILDKLVTLNNHDKKSDNFYIRYHKLPENTANFLGRQTKDLTRPDITFEFSQIHHRSDRYTQKSQLRFEPITITFADDDESLTSMILNAQLMRQINKHTDVYGLLDAGREREYKFDVQLELFNSQGQVVEGYIFKNCFFSSIQHSQASVASDENNEIITILQYDNIDMLFFDTYVSVM